MTAESISVRGAAIWAISAQYVSFAIQFVVSVVVARYFLAPDEVGLFSLAFSTAAIVAVLQDFGLNRYVAGEPDLTPDRIRACLTISTVFALVIGFIVLLIAWPAARFYGDMRLLTLLLIVAASYLFVPFSTVTSALRQRAMDFKSMFIIDVGTASVNGIVTLALAAGGFSVFALAGGVFAQQAARAALSQWRNGWLNPWPLSFAFAMPIIKFGSGASVLSISGTVGARTPELVIGRLLSFAALGLYGRATGLAAQLRMLVSGAVSSVFYPAFARIRDSGEPLGPPYVRVVSAYCAVTWPAMAMLAVASRPIIVGLYGENWAGAAPLLTWIALSQICFVALPLHIELPMLLGRFKTLIIYNLIDATASVALLAIAALSGLEWVAISRLVYGFIWLMIYSRFLQRMVQFSWQAIGLVYLKSAIVTLAAVAPLLAGALFLPNALTFATLTIGAGAGVLCWALAMFAVNHPASEEMKHITSSIYQPLMKRWHA